MATIKPIEARSVHQIQSGQVIVDLCSVAKELIENSLDAGATSIEVRFKNNGLDLIEVQDNGSGISRDNYENVALKHYTSKLSSYDDLARLHTFGFRGEALSSLCALSDFRVVTAQAQEVPKANKLDFEPSGKLKKTQIVAGQKGTTASVEGIFKRLPVRRRELEKNIKREYGKVLNLLHAYACISAGVRFSVKNTVGKTRNVVVFSTKGNQTTKENIANVYGAKTLLALIPLDLTVEFEPSAAVRRATGGELNKISVRGHVSRPVFGEGRQTPDRQMFFVNSRPCGLPQIAKAFNEVYKSFNVSQSPFVFADFHMDTDAYDVNVSPDKRTILLHDAGALIESLKASLTDHFESADQTVPQSQVTGPRQPSVKQSQSLFPSFVSNKRPANQDEEETEAQEVDDGDKEGGESQPSSQGRLRNLIGDFESDRSRAESPSSSGQDNIINRKTTVPLLPVHTPQPHITPSEEGHNHVEEPKIPSQLSAAESEVTSTERPPEPESLNGQEPEAHSPQSSRHVHQAQAVPEAELDPLIESPNKIQNAYDRMRPRRMPAEVATITIGNRTVTSMVGSGVPKRRNSDAVGSGQSASRKKRIHTPSRPNIFSKHMRDFAAPGTQIEYGDSEDEERGETGGEEDEEVYQEEQSEEEVSDYRAESDIHSDDDASQQFPAGTVQDVQGQEITEEEGELSSQLPPAQTGKSMDDEEKKQHDEAEVQRLIREAEEKATLPHESSTSRVNKMSKGAYHRDSTVQLVSTINGSISRIQSLMERLQSGTDLLEMSPDSENEYETTLADETAEERLSLTVTKDDFAQMRIIGQFNLGFILATRSSSSSGSPGSKDELFIIDQHASDEKFNFERLQAETVVQNQRLVQPKTLDLTAVEEEIVIENQAALEKNGFIVEVDESGDEPIGRRCKLVSLPLSKEVVFGVRDLEELIVLLSEMPASSTTGDGSHKYVPRPGKVRKMFAMRACRSSIMIGKNLTSRQMEKVVRNMGTIDKPWNCPHGRPTMRHLMSLGQWNEWDESVSNALDDTSDDEQPRDSLDPWREYLKEMASDDEDQSTAEIEDEEKGHS
ncbi:hypothetical protein FE257_005591 [Aspergillus nanangensis]|uniref:DNA mismatch repair protein PMS1 n=1 Tax=Aspergillus nanangensis TaxID=2582783 RepID=A0AAD4GVJ5_ASPNN|nr:hypothetical protein FE257_005591 [Aspergillus nanangensis]